MIKIKSVGTRLLSIVLAYTLMNAALPANAKASTVVPNASVTYELQNQNISFNEYLNAVEDYRQNQLSKIDPSKLIMSDVMKYVYSTAYLLNIEYIDENLKQELIVNGYIEDDYEFLMVNASKLKDIVSSENQVSIQLGKGHIISNTPLYCNPNDKKMSDYAESISTIWDFKKKWKGKENDENYENYRKLYNFFGGFPKDDIPNIENSSIGGEFGIDLFEGQTFLLFNEMYNRKFGDYIEGKLYFDDIVSVIADTSNMSRTLGNDCNQK